MQAVSILAALCRWLMCALWEAEAGLICNIFFINETLLASRCVWHFTHTVEVMRQYSLLCFYCKAVTDLMRPYSQFECFIMFQEYIEGWYFPCVRVCLWGWMSDLPAVEFESQPQLSVVDDHVSSHMLLCPNAVWQSLFQSEKPIHQCEVIFLN